MSIRAGVLPTLVIVALGGCGGGGDPAGPGGGGDNGFTATFAGQAWASDGAPYLQLTSGSTPGSLLISGQDFVSATNYRSISLILGRIEGPGTYPLGVDGSTVAGGNANLIHTNGTTVTLWSTPVSGSAGSLTITSLTASRIVGNFSFVAAPLPGQSGTNQTVTGGHFDLPLPSNFVVASGTSRGSVMSGTIGGNPWNAASVTPVGTLPFVVLGGSNSTTYQLFITPFPGISQGLFPLSGGTTVRVNQVGAANGWGTTGSTGSVTISSFNGSRVVGSFTATLTPIGSTTGNLTASGSFDINLNLTN